MGGDLSDDDSIHLHTPPKGTGRCCAGRFCIHTHSRYFPSGLCCHCGGYAHDKDCAQVGYDGIWQPGKQLVCLLCVNKHLTGIVKAKEREKRKARESSRMIHKHKKMAAIEIHQITNPFNYNQMQKVLKENHLDGYLDDVKIGKIKRKQH